MRNFFATLMAGLVFAGCYGFDPVADRFSCESDDDCMKGYVCNGHTMVHGNAVSYCVAPKHARMAFAARLTQSPFTCEVNGDGSAAATLTVHAGTRILRAGDTPHSAQTTAPTSFDCAELEGPDDDRPCCAVDMDKGGGGGVICTRPLDDNVEALSIWVDYRNSQGQTRLLLFDSQPLPSSGPQLIEHTFHGGHWDRDIPEPGAITDVGAFSNRCQLRAAPRIQHCNPDATAEVCLCDGPQNDTCPVGYFCSDRAANNSCWPLGYGQPADGTQPGTACDAANAKVCESRDCDNTTQTCR